MGLPIELISTDFDGTIHTDFEDPPIAEEFQKVMRELQAQGVIWVINTGRDLSSLMESLARSRVTIRPDYVVVVEREVYQLKSSQYLPVEPWNASCSKDHARLFASLKTDLPDLVEWIKARFTATIYEDPYSPFCLIANNNKDADQIHAYLEAYCARRKDICFVRNDIYGRFSHAAYNKGTALAEVARLLGIKPERIFAAGDHYNDLPMLNRSFAHQLLAPANAIDLVKEQVRQHQGFVSQYPHAYGVAEGLAHYINLLQSGRANL